MVYIIVNGTQNEIRQLLTQFLTLLIDLAVVSTTEIDALEGASRIATLGNNLFQLHLTMTIDDEGLTRLQLLDIIGIQIKRSLQYRTFRCQRHHLVVMIIECRTNAPRVTHGEHLARTRQSTYHIAAIKIGHRGTKHITHLHMVVDISGDVCARKTLLLSFDEVALYLTVQTMAHPLQHDVGVAIDTRALSLGCNLLEHLIDIGHIEVATQTEVLGFPVVAAQERMDVCQSRLSCSGIAEMTHIEFTIEVTIDAREDFSDSVFTFSLFAEHVFRPRLRT